MKNPPRGEPVQREHRSKQSGLDFDRRVSPFSRVPSLWWVVILL